MWLYKALLLVLPPLLLLLLLITRAPADTAKTPEGTVVESDEPLECSHSVWGVRTTSASIDLWVFMRASIIIGRGFSVKLQAAE